jgi:glycosyltransferase involved in cell wall biosynthesis
MHVGLVSPAWPPSLTPNGIVAYVDGLQNELLAQGHRVSIFPLRSDGQARPGVHLVEPGRSDRLRSRALRLAGRRGTVFDTGRTIASTIRRVHSREPIDVVEMEESFGWAADVAAGTSIPVVVKLHGPAFLTMVEEELQTAFGAEKVRREGLALERSPVIIAPSHCTLRETVARYRLKPRVAERVVNPLAAAADLPLWDPATCDHRTLLFVGRFDKTKGADVLILAFRRLLVDHPDLKLVFVGPDGGLTRHDGPNVHLPEFVAALGDPAVERNLDYRGRLRSDDIAALRTSAVVTVIASRRENQPYSALEALLQGCPVVCTDTSGLSELIEHDVTGLKARPEDPDDLAAQIRRLLDRPELGRALGLAGRRHVLEHHAPAVVVRQTLEIYRQAIELARAGARATH